MRRHHLFERVGNKGTCSCGCFRRILEDGEKSNCVQSSSQSGGEKTKPIQRSAQLRPLEEFIRNRWSERPVCGLQSLELFKSCQVKCCARRSGTQKATSRK